MFLLIRLLFVLLVIGFGWAGFKYLQTSDTRYLRYIRWLLSGVIGLLLVFFVGLAIERIFWS